MQTSACTRAVCAVEAHVLRQHAPCDAEAARRQRYDSDSIAQYRHVPHGPAHLRRVLQQDVQARAGACVPHAHAVVRQGGYQAAVVGRPADLYEGHGGGPQRKLTDQPRMESKPGSRHDRRHKAVKHLRISDGVLLGLCASVETTQPTRGRHDHRVPHMTCTWLMAGCGMGLRFCFAFLMSSSVGGHVSDSRSNHTGTPEAAATAAAAAVPLQPCSCSQPSDRRHTCNAHVFHGVLSGAAVPPRTTARQPGGPAHALCTVPLNNTSTPCTSTPCTTPDHAP